jgi:hypothetical protein
VCSVAAPNELGVAVQQPTSLSELSIIVPIGPDDSSWHGVLDALRALPTAQIVLVFADAVPEIVATMHLQTALLRAIAAPRGRATQLNAGAAFSSGKFLWFLHADSRLGVRTAEALQRHLRSDDGLSLGYFDLRFTADGPWQMCVNVFGAWLRCRVFKLPFGDQGFVLSRSLFEQLGGFDQSLASAEDHQLVWRARAVGARIKAIGAPLHTSARKYATQGWWRTTVKHLGLTWTQARAFSRGRRP